MATSRAELEQFLREHPKVRCGDFGRVLDKLEKIRAEGMEKFYVISDFDATISKHHDENDPEQARLPSTFGVIEEDKNLPPDVAKIAKDNYTKYYPKEMDVSIPAAEKLDLMVEWWSSTQQAVVSAKTVTKKGLLQTVQDSKVCLRNNSEKFIHQLAGHQPSAIPLLIFSAGCGDIIDLMLKNKPPVCWHEENMVLVSNSMKFDESSDLLVDWSKPTIHSMNKKNALERLNEDSDKSKFEKLSELIEGRCNMFVMGDHLRDGDMKVGMPDIQTFIDIGFLNYNSEKNLPTYMQTFDLVLEDDQSFDVVIKLFEFISK